MDELQTDSSSPGRKPFRIANSLKTQINAAILAIVLVVMGFYAGFTYFSTKADMVRTLDQAADITAQKLSKQLREPLWALDDDLITESLTAEMLDRDIFAIIVIERDGKTAYKGLSRDSDGSIVESLDPPSGELTSKRASVTRGRDTIGAVEVYFSDKYMKDEFRKTMITILVIMVVLMVTIVLFVSYIFQRLVIHPILELTSLADRISMGDLETDINITANNEIGLLARAFNRLKTSMQISMQAFNARQ